MSAGWEPRAPRVHVVHPVRADPTGRAGPTPGQARGRSWRRTSYGWYVPADVSDELVEQRIVEAAVGLTTGMVTGWPALRLLGGGFFDGLERDGKTRIPVSVAAGRDRIRKRAGVDVTRSPVHEHEVVTRYGVRCALPDRALFDLMRWTPSPEDRVIAMDMAAAAELTSVARMRDYARRPRHLPGRLEVIAALEYSNEQALSPQEVRLRLLWQRVCGPTRLLSNPTIRDAEGTFVGMPDLLEPRTGVTGEFVGAVHRTAAQHRRDVARADRFRRVGLEPVEFVGADLEDEGLVARRVREARSRAARHRPTWHLAAEKRPSLDERLDLRDDLRRRHGERDER